MNKGERARRLAACPWAAPAGPALARLAVSRQLLTAVSRSVGFAVTRTNKAVYLADPPVALVHTQPSTKATIAVRVVLTYDLPPGSTGSDCSSTGPAPRSPDASGCSLARQSSCGREPRCTVAARRRRATDWPASASLQPPTEQRSPGGPAEPPRTGSAPDNLSDTEVFTVGASNENRQSASEHLCDREALTCGAGQSRFGSPVLGLPQPRSAQGSNHGSCRCRSTPLSCCLTPFIAVGRLSRRTLVSKRSKPIRRPVETRKPQVTGRQLDAVGSRSTPLNTVGCSPSAPRCSTGLGSSPVITTPERAGMQDRAPMGAGKAAVSSTRDRQGRGVSVGSIPMPPPRRPRRTPNDRLASAACRVVGAGFGPRFVDVLARGKPRNLSRGQLDLQLARSCERSPPGLNSFRGRVPSCPYSPCQPSPPTGQKSTPASTGRRERAWCGSPPYADRRPAQDQWRYPWRRRWSGKEHGGCQRSTHSPWLAW